MENKRIKEYIDTLKDRMITLTDGYQYVILDQTEYNNEIYVAAHDVEDGKLGSDVTLYRVETTDKLEPNIESMRFIEEKDLDKIETVLSKLAY